MSSTATTRKLNAAKRSAKANTGLQRTRGSNKPTFTADMVELLTIKLYESGYLTHGDGIPHIESAAKSYDPTTAKGRYHRSYYGLLAAHDAIVTAGYLAEPTGSGKVSPQVTIGGADSDGNCRLRLVVK